jgi:hypothetical protein
MTLDISNTENWMNNLFSREFIKQAYCDSDFVDDYLDKRDTNPFDLNWIAADKHLKAYTLQHFSETEIREIEKIKEKWRKMFYQKTIKKTHHADLSAYISEDIDLITGYMLTGMKNDFIQHMMEAFENDQLPD